ncbi:alpha/beta fold hydrolase [Ruegeria atlantica]|uniref:alpha/beta fold hydrolase n=1 Tax=Ruegeria atlantica TaxID=81569 RepID=UPI00147A8DA7|nr:alpha/beta fold hydrolase [Ruegeria atlantica]
MNYSFGEFTLDTAGLELRVRGTPVSIEPKVLEILIYLVENRDRVVTRDELVAQVWNGRIVSDAAISSGISSARRALGDNGNEQRFIRTLHGRGFRFAYNEVCETTGETITRNEQSGTWTSQKIQFCHSSDGTRIAYATAGSGPPLIKAANWLSHLEFDWDSPIWRHLFQLLSRGSTFVRYDARGNGLSDWNVSDHSLERQLEDFEAVVDAAKFDKFSLIGLSQGSIRSVAYAARYPDRVDKLILIGGYTQGWKLRDDPGGLAYRHAALEMIKHWWDRENIAIRQMFTNMYIPDASPDLQQLFSEMQRRIISKENAEIMMKAMADEDIRPLLPKVTAPTLVIHARNDAAAPYSQGLELAAGIRGAEFVTLETANHHLLASDPVWKRCETLIRDFLDA